MELKVCWLYHDIMDLYGDKGNMMVLKKRAEDRGIKFILDTCGIGQQANMNDYDLIFLGGGADKEQLALMPDLLKRKDSIVEALNNGTFALLICGGYQLFGDYYIASDGSKIEGLKIQDYYTESGQEGNRCIGNIIIDAKLDDIHTKIIGFENHGGQTMNVSKPLGKTVVGYGNSFTSGYEGYYDGKMLGTYLHGPLLPKNPKVADFVLSKAIQKRNPSFHYRNLGELNNPLETQARKVMFNRLKVEYED